MTGRLLKPGRSFIGSETELSKDKFDYTLD